MLNKGELLSCLCAACKHTYSTWRSLELSCKALSQEDSVVKGKKHYFRQNTDNWNEWVLLPVLLLFMWLGKATLLLGAPVPMELASPFSSFYARDMDGMVVVNFLLRFVAFPNYDVATQVLGQTCKAWCHRDYGKMGHINDQRSDFASRNVLWWIMKCLYLIRGSLSTKTLRSLRTPDQGEWW